jgi:hypothetical protein
MIHAAAPQLNSIFNRVLLTCRCYAAGIAECDEKWLAEIALIIERRRRGMTGLYRQDDSCRCSAAGIAECDKKWLAEIALIIERRRRAMLIESMQSENCSSVGAA